MTPGGWALVTGAGRRLGQVLALSAAEAGHDVLVHARRAADGGQTAAAIEALGRGAIIVEGDLADPDLPGRLVAAAPGPLTLLVNNASLFADDSAESFTARSLDEAHAVNVRAPLLLAQAFAAALPAEARGLIVNMIDQKVWRLNPLNFSYTVSRAALWAATQTLAQALAPRIRVNAIGPGPTLANIHQDVAGFATEVEGIPMRAAVSPAEIGAALKYLISAPSVTGQMIAVDGGQHIGWRTPDTAHA